MRLKLQTTGFHELIRVFRSLPDAAQQRVYRSALSKGADPVLNEAKMRAPKSKIRENIVKKLNKRGSALGPLTVSIITRKSYNPVTNVGSRRIRPYGQKDAFWSVWYEFGKRGQPATPYMGTAFNAQKRAAFEEFRRVFALGIQREVRKLHKQNMAGT